MDTETKPWYISKGVLGPALSVIAIGANYFGYKIDPDTQAIILDQGIAAVSAIVAAFGAFMGIYGRIKATKPIA